MLISAHNEGVHASLANDLLDDAVERLPLFQHLCRPQTADLSVVAHVQLGHLPVGGWTHSLFEGLEILYVDEVQLLLLGVVGALVSVEVLVFAQEVLLACEKVCQPVADFRLLLVELLAVVFKVLIKRLVEALDMRVEPVNKLEPFSEWSHRIPDLTQSPEPPLRQDIQKLLHLPTVHVQQFFLLKRSQDPLMHQFQLLTLHQLLTHPRKLHILLILYDLFLLVRHLN